MPEQAPPPLSGVLETALYVDDMERARAFAASTSRDFGAACVSSEQRSRAVAAAISATAAAKTASFAWDGFV